MTASYAYDPQSRRKLKTVGSTKTVYITDAYNREVAEYNGATGALSNWYAYNLSSDGVLNQMNAAGTTRATFIPDIQGSIVGSLDASTGTLTKTGYQPFGQNPANYTGSFRYTGRRIDPETGGSASQPSALYYYRARMYSPTLGRFLQADPIGYAGGNNLYAYVGNDPLDAIDPSGLTTYFVQGGGSLIGGVGGILGGGFYYTTNNAFGLPDIGVFGTAGPAVGASLGVGVAAGYASGNISDFRGRTLNVDLGAGPITYTASFTPTGVPSQTFQQLAGQSLGLAVGTAASADVSSPTTKAAGLLENLIVPAVNNFSGGLGMGQIFKPAQNTGSGSSGANLGK